MINAWNKLPKKLPNTLLFQVRVLELSFLLCWHHMHLGFGLAQIVLKVQMDALQILLTKSILEVMCSLFSSVFLWRVLISVNWLLHWKKLLKVDKQQLEFSKLLTENLSLQTAQMQSFQKSSKVSLNFKMSLFHILKIALEKSLMG